MKIATFNLENIFHRDAGLVKRTIDQSIQAWVEEFETLISKSSRAGAEIARMRELSFLLGFHKSAFEPHVVMRRKAGNLFLRKKNFNPANRASNLTGWNGWVKVQSRPINPIAVANKARVIAEANPDVLIVQEVEDRQSLVEFNKHYLPNGVRFSQIVLLSGNSKDGREMAVMTKNKFSVLSVRSHGRRSAKGAEVFDKDLQECVIEIPSGEKFIILATHFEDPGDQEEVMESRRRQSVQTARVYHEIMENEEDVILAGTLNAASFCSTLNPLLRQTDLQDVKKHPQFSVDPDEGKDAGYYSLGAYRMGVNLKQKDYYFLLSPLLFPKLKGCGLIRKGIFPRKKGQWKCYPSLQAEGHQASSHPLIWGEIRF